MSPASSYLGAGPGRRPSERFEPSCQSFGCRAATDPAPRPDTCSRTGRLTASTQRFAVTVCTTHLVTTRPAAPGRRACGPARFLAAGATAALLAAAGCSTSSETTRPASPATVADIPRSRATPQPAPVSFRPTAPVHRGVDATAACVLYARMAGDVDTATSTLGRARRAAARAYSTPQLQALYDDAGEGRNREQETWQKHHARVTVTVRPDPDHLDALGGHGHGHGAGVGAGAAPSGTPVAVIVTGSARGTDGWSAPTAPYRLDCLTLQDPVAGWLVDDAAISPIASAAG